MARRRSGSPLTETPVFEKVDSFSWGKPADDPRELPGGTFDARHLPGKHDQSTHGHGHDHGSAAGGEFKPGAWKEDSGGRQARIAETEAMLKRDTAPWLQKRAQAADGADWATKAATELVDSQPADTRVFTNGPHKIIVKSNKVSDEQLKEFMVGVDALQTHAPANTDLSITIDRSSTFPLGVGGETMTGTGSIRINEQMFSYAEKNMTFNTGGVTMPVAQRVVATKYVLAHEWGHAVDNQTGTKNISEMARSPKVRKAMSDYGVHGGPHEAYAEAFAEWAYTRGTTENVAAQAYAKAYGWGERWPSLATTSKAA